MSAIFPEQVRKPTSFGGNGIFLSTDDNLEKIIQKIHKQGQTKILVTQTAHGFSAKKILRINSSGVFVGADSSSLVNCGKFFVVEVVDVNNFYVQEIGYVSGLTGGTAGQLHYLQDDGSLLSTPGKVEQKIIYWISTTEGWLLGEGLTNPKRFLTSPITNGNTYSLGTTAAEYEIYDSADISTFAKLIFNGTTLTMWFFSDNVETSDTASKLCIYLDTGTLTIKNNLGSSKNLAIWRKEV